MPPKRQTRLSRDSLRTRPIPDFHYETTARELYEQMGGQIDAVVIGSGTGGTFTGVARYLKERNPASTGHRH